MRRTVATVLCLMLLGAACASDGGATAPPDSPAPTREDASTSTSASPTTSLVPSSTPPTETTPATSSTTTSVPVETVPGPTPGSAWMVVAVPSGDSLNVRSGPGVDYDVLGTLTPRATGVIAVGEAAVVDMGVWWSLNWPVEGWVNSWYLAGAGSTEDRTSEVVERLGEIPSAATMSELMSIVLASFDDVATTVVLSSDEGSSNGEQVVDVFPTEGDDSVRGYRLAVFGQRDRGSAPFALSAVELTHLCWRGVDAVGLCV